MTKHHVSETQKFRLHFMRQKLTFQKTSSTNKERTERQLFVVFVALRVTKEFTVSAPKLYRSKQIVLTQKPILNDRISQCIFVKDSSAQCPAQISPL